MQATMIVSSGEAEVVWNAFRLANLMLNEGDEVNIFLHGPAVEYRRLDSEQFPLQLLAKTFALSEGVLRAWGKSLGIHGVDEDQFCKKSTQKELYDFIAASDRVLCF